jgi:large repetitive protein
LTNAPVCEDDTLRLTAENAGIGASYEWRKLGGNVVSSSSQFTVNNSQLINSGKYILKVTLNNCVNYDTIEVEVKKRPVFVLSNNSPVCEGDSIQLFANGAPVGTTFSWSGPQQFLAINSSVVRPKATLGMAGLYQVTATLGGCTFADTIRASIKSLPEVNAISNSPVCEGENLELSTISTPNATYLWKSPNGTTISSSSQFTVRSLPLNAAGKYSVLVTLNGCKNTDTVLVEVKPKPAFSIDSVICAPSLKIYTVYGKSNGNVSGAEGSVSQNNGVFSVSSIAIGTKSVLTFSKNGCDTTFEINSPNCSCPNIAVAVSPPSQTICEGDTLQTLHAIVSTGTTADWYDAPTGGQLLASGTLTFKPSLAGKLYVEARAEASGCLSATRAVAEVIINTNPSFTATTVATSCDGLNTRKDGKLQIAEVVNGQRYDFSFGSTYTGNKTYATAKNIPANGILTDTLSNPTISQTYTVRVFDATGCFSDRVATSVRRDCICPAPPFVVPESQSVCDGDTLRTVRGFVEPGVTIDWYDEQGNLLKKGSIFFKPTQAGVYYAQARDTLSGCKGLVRAPSYAFINPHPSFQAIVTRGTCNGTEVLTDGKISLKDIKNGKHYDYTKGQIYTGSKTYDTAEAIPSNGAILSNLVNPTVTEFYTIRVFDSTSCYTDSTVAYEPRICECPRPPFVVPESQAVCAGDTLRTVQGFVDSGITVDWYDAPTGGNLLKQGSIFFKPTQAGIYYAEARDTTNNCKGIVRVPSYAFVNDLPSFELETDKATCVDFVAQNDGKIRIKNLNNGAKYDLSIGNIYTGDKTFDTAKEIPADSILLSQVLNPSISQSYTIRVFGEPNCFIDKVVTINKVDCGCKTPSFDWVVTRGTCNGTEVLPDGKITLVDVKNGKRYDYSKSKIYTGNKTYTTASDIASNGLILSNLVNPAATEFYTVRVFDSTGCFTDSTVAYEPRICECPRPPFVVPESQAVCAGDTLRTVQGFVDSGITVDWYDAPTGGNLLKQGSIFFKPTQAGIYYAEARDTTNNCKGIVRVPSYAFVNDLPSFELEAQQPSCLQNTAQNDGKIRVKDLKNGTKYDVSLGSVYTGDKTFDTANEIPADSILFNQVPNPSISQTYMIRVFGEPNCFTDRIINITHFDCNCSPITVKIITPSRVCQSDTLPTLTAFVSQDETVDWYDAAVNGNVLKTGSNTFKPTQVGIYYAEGRSLIQTGCVSTQRVAVKVEFFSAPSFRLTTRPATCLGDSAKTDAQLIVENLIEGDRFDYSLGNVYTGNANYDNAQSIPPNGLIAAKLPNITQNYIVRIFNRCGLFKDITVQLIKNECRCSPPNCFPLQMKLKKKKVL